MYFVYLLSSQVKPSQIHIGSTNNLERRLQQHNQGKVFSTKPFLPWDLVYYEAY